MTAQAANPPATAREADRPDLVAVLGILFGILMPVASALLFVTYVDSMPTYPQERARLLELHFVAAEIGVAIWAASRGFRFADWFAALPRDIRIALAAFIGAIFASSLLLATNRGDALLQSTIQLIHIHFAAAVWYLATLQRAREGDRLLHWLCAGLPILALWTALRIALPPAPELVPGGEIIWDMALPGWISVRHLAIWLCAIAAALLVRQLQTPGAKLASTNAAILFFTLAFMFWTGTRATVPALCLAVLAALALTGTRVTLRDVACVGLIAAAAFATAVAFAFDHPSFSFFDQAAGGGIRASSSGRYEMWAAVVARASESPLIGWGTGSVLWDISLGWRHTQPHNAALQFWLDWGFVGLAAAAWLGIRGLLAAASSARTYPGGKALLAMALAILAMSMADGALYYPRFIILALVCFALLLSGSEGGRREADSPPGG